ncbi:MAG: histidine phosphatase family protein [Muribaculum sp.]|nr:histidine phosphatase family protein [Muribaculum sp.]
MKFRILSLAFFLISTVCLHAVNPTATSYSAEQCQGSAMPYPAVDPMLTAYPDSLRPIMVNHVGRHGARYASSAKRSLKIKTLLLKADSAKTITPKGKELLSLVNHVISISDKQWGALDSLGMAEQRGIASRMYMRYPNLFTQGKIYAMSSYAPRCIMSMYSFTHQIARLNNKVKIYTNSGRQNSTLLRPFDLDQDYIDYRKSEPYDSVYKSFLAQTTPLEPVGKLLGSNFDISDEDASDFVHTLYGFLSGMGAIGLPVQLQNYFTPDEYNRLWSCNNLGQYLERTANTISSIPADIASDLLLELITTTDDVIEGKSDEYVQLRFGHAETLMPLLSLMHLRGCYYLTNYFDSVGLNWKNFHVVPMASNLQLIIFKSKSGRYYVRVELNEIPIPLIPGSDNIYVNWHQAKDYLQRCLPIDKQL